MDVYFVDNSEKPRRHRQTNGMSHLWSKNEQDFIFQESTWSFCTIFWHKWFILAPCSFSGNPRAKGEAFFVTLTECWISLFNYFSSCEGSLLFSSLFCDQNKQTTRNTEKKVVNNAKMENFCSCWQSLVVLLLFNFILRYSFTNNASFHFATPFSSSFFCPYFHFSIGIVNNSITIGYPRIKFKKRMP